MISNAIEFYALLEGYENDPATCSKILRTFALADSANFLPYFQEAILKYPMSRAIRYMVALAVQAGVAKTLIEQFPRDRSRILSVAKKIASTDTRFDLAIAEYLPETVNGVPNSESAVQAALDILEVISEGDRLVPQVLKLLKNSNPKIRSKAALFVGTRTQNLSWATKHTNDADGRVRANMVESLSGLNSDAVLNIYRNHVHDENNRAAGNAILGLYQLGDAGAIPFIHEIAHHPDARFRNTAAWLIGRTGDSRFAHLLAELMQDSDPLVRSQGFKALADMKRSARAQRPELKVGILKMNPKPGTREMVVSVCDTSWEPVRRIQATGFVAYGSTISQAAQNYAVSEFECRYSLSLGFLFCLPDVDTGSLDAAFRRAVESCTPRRRPKDRWAVAKLQGRLLSRRSGSPASDNVSSRSSFNILNVGELIAPATPALAEHKFEYTTTPERIDAMLQQAPIQVAVEEAELKYLVAPLLRIDPSCGKTHLVFFGAGPQSDVLQFIASKMMGPAVVLHVIAVHDEWRTPEVHRLVETSGGYLLEANDDESLQTAVSLLLSSLLHHYRLTWTDEVIPSTVSVQAAQGRGNASDPSRAIAYSAMYAATLDSEPVLAGSV